MGLPLGARLKLLKAISALALGAEPIGLTPAVAPAGPPADTAERRQVGRCSRTLSATRSRYMDQRTCARLFRPITNASPRSCTAAMGSWHNIGRRRPRVLWLSASP
jgi:hypothetical protein